MARETRPLMEKLPYKPAPMDYEAEIQPESSKLGWEDAPTWPIETEPILEEEPNCPISKKKIFLLENAVKKMTNSL